MSRLTRPFRRFTEWVIWFEELPFGPLSIMSGLAAVIVIRNVVEIAVARNPAFHGISAFVHYPLAYVGPFLALTLVLAFWARVAPARVARLMMMAWFLTLIPPLADLVHEPRDAATIGYLSVHPDELPWVFVHFLDPSVALTGTTPGIRIETFLAVVLGAFYVVLRSGKFARMIGAVISIYVVSLFFFSLPVLVLAISRWLNPPITRQEFLFARGVLHRPDTETSPDSLAILWLIPLLLLLIAIWRWLERWHPEESFVRGKIRIPQMMGLTVFPMLMVVAGRKVAEAIHSPDRINLSTLPFELLAPMAAALAIFGISMLVLPLSLSCEVGGREQREEWRVIWFGIAAALLLALGTPVALCLAAVGGALLPIRWCKHLPAWSHPFITSASFAVASSSGMLAGYALVIGPEALARIPRALLLLPALVGAALALITHPKILERWWVPPLVLGFAFGAGVSALAGYHLLVVAFPAGVLAATIGGWIDRMKKGPPRYAVATALIGGLGVMWLFGAAMTAEPVRKDLEAIATCVPRIERLRGWEHQQEGRNREARTRYRRAMECAGEEDAASHRGIGMSLAAEGKFGRALKSFEQSLELEPNSLESLNNLAGMYLELGRPEEALASLARALEISPRDTDVLHNRARALEDAGRVSEAIEAWQEFIEVADLRPESWSDRDRARKRLRELKRRQKGDSMNEQDRANDQKVETRDQGSMLDNVS